MYVGIQKTVRKHYRNRPKHSKGCALTLELRYQSPYDNEKMSRRELHTCSRNRIIKTLLIDRTVNHEPKEPKDSRDEIRESDSSD